jgi:hypothetical protein
MLDIIYRMCVTVNHWVIPIHMTGPLRHVYTYMHTSLTRLLRHGNTRYLQDIIVWLYIATHSVWCGKQFVSKLEGPYDI